MNENGGEEHVKIRRGVAKVDLLIPQQQVPGWSQVHDLGDVRTRDGVLGIHSVPQNRGWRGCMHPAWILPRQRMEQQQQQQKDDALA